jgi:hypothetical protein
MTLSGSGDPRSQQEHGNFHLGVKAPFPDADRGRKLRDYFFSMFQKVIAGPVSSPLTFARAAVGTVNWPSCT